MAVAIWLSGCSKRTTVENTKTSPHEDKQQKMTAGQASRWSDFVVEESREGKELHEIRTQAAQLLKSGQFEELDDVARQYRASKTSFPDGHWKLGEFYRGIIPGDEANDSDWKTTLHALNSWEQARPKSVTAHVALANFLVSYAWKARGNDWATNVTEMGWKLMRERLTLALNTLKEAEMLEEKCPAQWSVLFSIALGMDVPKPQYEKLWKQAVDLYPRYPNYYFSKAYYLLPRWHGGPNDTADFMTKAADALGGDDGDLLYAQTAYSLQTSIGGNVIEECNLSAERIDKGLKVIEKRFPDSIQARNLCAYMTLFGATKLQPVLDHLNALHGKIDPSIWDKERFVLLTKNVH